MTPIEEKEFVYLKKLMSLLFEKAEQETRSSQPSKWFEFIKENLGILVSEKTLSRYYKKYITEESSEINFPNEQIVDEISKWLGYRNYADFLNQYFPLQEPSEKRVENEVFTAISKKRKTSLNLRNLGMGSLIGLGLIWGVNSLSEKENCMFWDEWHYQRIDCNKSLAPSITLEPFDENKWKYFKRIEVDEKTPFFEGGKPKVWYLKTDGEVEFFSAPGEHPINGKQLKPITKYMIDKYVINKK